MLKTKHLVFLIVLAIPMLALLSTENTYADHTREHCDEQFEGVPPAIRNAELPQCYANIPTTTERPGADATGTSTSLEAPTSDLNTGTLNVEDNPIYTRLIQIINFLSVGVGIVAAISAAVAGVQYTASRGDPNKTAAAVHRLTQVGIAIFLYVFGFAILNWLIPGGVLN